jgi:hypothetical protein
MEITKERCATSLARRLTVAALLILGSSALQAELIEQELEFSSEDQSMWGTGDAFQLDETQFYGATWNESGSAGGFVGGESDVINPLWLLWNACPFLCPPEPDKFFQVDTTSGLQVSATTQGRIGFELGVTIDSGSVDAIVDYTTEIVTPDSQTVAGGEFISLNPSSTLTGDSLQSQFPTMSASLGVVMEVSAQFAATGCLLGSCDSASFSTGNLGGTQELISFNEDGEGGIEYFGGSGLLSDLAEAAGAPTGFPAEIAIPAPGLGNIATITAHLPEPNTSGGVNAAGTMLTSTGQDDLLDLSLDIDNIISLGLTGVGGLFGGDQDFGAGFGVSYDLINVEFGPQLDLVQSFEFTPTLFVDLEFSNPVNVTGFGMVSSLTGLVWDLLPTMAFQQGSTLITPTFYLGANIGGEFFANAGELFNQLFLDIDGNIKVDLLQAAFNTPFGDLSFGIGNIINESFNLFTTPALFSSRFAMAGFDPILGSAFIVTVPAPGTLFLLCCGLIMIMTARWRRRSS